HGVTVPKRAALHLGVRVERYPGEVHRDRHPDRRERDQHLEAAGRREGEHAATDAYSSRARSMASRKTWTSLSPRTNSPLMEKLGVVACPKTEVRRSLEAALCS